MYYKITSVYIYICMYRCVCHIDTYTYPRPLGPSFDAPSPWSHGHYAPPVSPGKDRVASGSLDGTIRTSGWGGVQGEVET